MKKILIFSLAYLPREGGAEVAVKEIASRLDMYEWHLVTLRFDRTSPKTEQIGRVHVHRIGFGGSRFNKLYFQFAAALKARSLHKHHHFDAMWAVMAHSSGVPAALFKMLHPHVPFILTLQEGDPPEEIEQTMKPLWPLFTRAFTKADKVQAISNFLGEWARRRGYKGPLEVIPNGVDTAHFAKAQDRFAIRKALDIRENETVLVTSSRLVHKNAVDDCIRALPDLAGVHFLVLGAGLEETKLKRLTAEVGVAERVYFVGYIPHQQLPAYLQASTIFVRPSRSEGMGNSFIEAFAAGLPVIATQEGGIADFLFDAKRNPDKPTTGWAVDKDAPKQIAAAVQEILAHPEQTKSIVEEARRLAFEKYDWDLVAQQMKERVFSRI